MTQISGTAPSRDRHSREALHRPEGRTDVVMVRECIVQASNHERTGALDLALSVEDAGGSVIGPAATIEEALTLLDGVVSGAILDVHLPDGDVGPVLHKLMARGIPVVVQTGGGLPARLKQAYPDLRVLTKPNDPARLVATLCEAMAE